MPTYDFRCTKCGEDFEYYQSFSDEPLKKHPGCGGKVTKVMSAAGIVLKGSGFYKTDSTDSARSRSKQRSHATAGSDSGSSGGDSGSSGSGSGSGGSDSTGNSNGSNGKETSTGGIGSPSSGSGSSGGTTGSSGSTPGASGSGKAKKSA
jgi:putative FmdB family regulatory protein